MQLHSDDFPATSLVTLCCLSAQSSSLSDSVSDSAPNDDCNHVSSFRISSLRWVAASGSDINESRDGDETLCEATNKMVEAGRGCNSRQSHPPTTAAFSLKRTHHECLEWAPHINNEDGLNKFSLTGHGQDIRPGVREHPGWLLPGSTSTRADRVQCEMRCSASNVSHSAR